MERTMQRSLAPLLALLVAVLAATIASPAAAADHATLAGSVASGRVAIAHARVTVWVAGTQPGQATPLAHAVADRHGRFRLAYTPPASSGAVLYVTAARAGAVRLAATLGAPPAPQRIVVNEATTVATGFSQAQFIAGGRIGGPPPGPQNAALMAANLADVRTGAVSPVLAASPNGRQTSTLAKFGALANALAGCARSTRACPALSTVAATPQGHRPRGVLQAVANIAANPWHDVAGILRLSHAGPAPYRGALRSSRTLSDWMLPLRFVGDGKTMDGPGNFAIDRDGNVYVTNNYEYAAGQRTPTCGSDLLPVFTPDGRFAPGTPFQGGGLTGAGFGITLDSRGNVWVGNYGFAAPEPNCPADRQPPHDTISAFTPDGTALAPDGFRGTTDSGPGPFSWPQGTVADPSGDAIWVANCGDGKLVRVPTSDPNHATAFDAGLSQAFDIAIDHQGLVYATGLGNSKLAILRPDGTPIPGSPFDAATYGLDRPMGIAADSAGNMWIANSALINLPCPTTTLAPAGTPSVSLVSAGGAPVTHGAHGFTGGGLTLPWGIAVDGNDNVWVANFSDQRISQFCGVPARHCRPGTTTGDPISPDGTGYFFDGLVRVTGVQIDPSGNLWAANNWKRLPDVQTNPGGYQVVVYPGAAAPLRTPLIGPPVPLLGR
jgi:DNA-binding beta-propeller fold protein YncE